MFKKKKIDADIILYISDHNIKKSMELKSGLELLNVEYEQKTTTERMPYVVFASKRENFSQAKAIIYERIKVAGQSVNRHKRRWMKSRGMTIVERRVGIFKRLARAGRMVVAKVKALTSSRISKCSK